MALKLMKKTIHDYYKDILSDTLDRENEALRATFKTHDMRESTKALSQKREPIFKGK